jgi:hypothetical protein
MQIQLLSTCLTMCGLKLNIDISAGPLTVPSMKSVKCRSQKLDHITYSNAFSFHSCAFYFLNNVAVKWYTLHMYIIYIKTSFTG